MIKIKSNNIPEVLKNKPHWVAFALDEEGKKIPINPKPNAFCSPASIADPTTWGTFEQAVKLVQYDLAVAVGYAIIKEDGLIFLDLDCHEEKCDSEEEKGKLKALYSSLCKSVGRIETYQETSISGKGVHLLAKGCLNDLLSRGSSPIAPIELYDDKRFIIVTGHKLNEFDVSDDFKVVGTLQNLHKQYFKPKIETGKGSNGELVPFISEPIRSDEEVLRIAMKEKDFVLLWNNRWEEVTDKNGNQKYSQQHYSDFVLIKKLIFYTGNCPTQAERLFRKSPCYLAYGRNGKWAKYEKDIANDLKSASSKCTAVYDPHYGQRTKILTMTTSLTKKYMSSRECHIVIPPENGTANCEIISLEKKKAPIASKVISLTKDTALVPTTDISVVEPNNLWKPDFKDIFRKIIDKENPLVQSTVLSDILINYLNTYSDNRKISYEPDLFRYDRNINGGTAVVKRMLGEKLKYSFQNSAFYIWEGKRYINYGDAEMLIHPLTEILSLVEHSVFLWFMGEAENYTNADTEMRAAFEKKAIDMFTTAKRFVSAKMAQDVLKKLKGMDAVTDIAAYYDTPYINMQNGVLNLITRELLPHDPIYNQSKITACDYIPQADCPEFKAMIKRLIPTDADRKELQKSFGLCLAKEHLPAKKVLMLLVGPKDSGKTTVLNSLVEVLGEYGAAVDNSLLMKSTKDKTVGPEMLDFKETLMITASETSETDRLDAGKIKSLTGDTTQSFRNNYATKMEKFRMTGLIYIDSNFKPYIDPRDSALWGRIRLFPFLCPVKKKDPDLKRKLSEEKAGIFNWLLEGLDMVLEDKYIFETPNMVEFKEQYIKEMDIVQQFLTDCVEKSENKSCRILTSVLYTTFKNWCKDLGYHESVRSKFYEEVQKFYDKKKSNSEYFINMHFTEIGDLYSKMLEKKPQQFAKEKRMILEKELPTDLPYDVLRQTYFYKSQPWFSENVTKSEDINVLYGKYTQYVDWCLDNGIMPLKVADYNGKVKYLKDSLVTTATPTSNSLELSRHVWTSA